MELDKLDWSIIKKLNKHEKINLMDLGMSLKVSHATIKYRMDKMTDKGIISKSYNVNSNLFKLSLFTILIHTNNKTEIKDKLTSCVKVIDHYDTIGDYNLVLNVLAEDITAVESMSNYCKIFNHDSITKKTILPILNYSGTHINIFPKKETKCIEKDEETCIKCKAFKADSCPGCPIMKDYKGSLKYVLSE